MFWLLCGLLLVFNGLPAFPTDRPDTDRIEWVSDHSTVELTFSTELDADSPTVTFLLENLDLATVLVRELDIDRLEAEQIDERTYAARDHAGLEGTVHQIKLEPSSSSFYGEGRYQSSQYYVWITGEAVAEIDLDGGSDTTGAEIDLSVRASNPFLHVAGVLFRPYIRRVARTKSDNLTDVAGTVVRFLNDHPEEALDRLDGYDRRNGTDFATRLRRFVSRRAERTAG